MKWYRKSAERGDTLAETMLGLCYRNGEGVIRDDAEAVKWYRKAVEANDPAAQINLGVCYENGYGVRQDLVEAYKLYKLAANNPAADSVLDEDREKLAGNLERIWVLMTTVEIAEGERRYREFRANH